MNASLILLLSALLACDGADAPAEPKAPKTEKVGKTKAKADPVKDAAPAQPDDPFSGLTGFDRARSLTAARKHRDALGELEGLLSTASDDERVWRLLRFVASTAGESSALLDRLDANTALGGQDAQHQLLRASLALDSDRPDDALDAAQKLSRADAELGAVYTARALLAGATLDTTAMSRDDANQVLVLASNEAKDREVTKLLKGSAPATWEGQLLRAEIRERIGDTAGARADLAAVLASDDPEASVRAAPLAARLVDDPVQAAATLADAALDAEEIGLSEQACALGADAVDGLLAVGQIAEAQAFALARHAKRTEAHDTHGAALASLAVADAALAHHHAALALDHATAAQGALTESDDADALQAAGWRRVQAGFSLGLPDEITSGAEAAGPDHAAAAESLGKILTGDPLAAADALAKDATTGAEGVRLQLAGARAAAATHQDPAPFTARAVELASAEGVSSVVLLEALLEQQRHAVDAGATTTALTGLTALADGLDSSGPLQAEIAVRGALAGAPGAAPDVAEMGPWAALLSGQTAEGDGPLYDLARARSLVGQNRVDDAEVAYHAGWAALPSHHRGPWAPISVLSGSAGVNIDRDAKLLSDSPNPKAALALLAAHDWWHAGRALDRAFGVGDDPSAALPRDERIAYNDAHCSLRGATLLWLAGQGPEPTEAQAALDAAETSAQSTAAFARAFAPGLPDYATVQSELKGMAILSFRLGPKSADAVVVTPDSARAKVLKSTSAITDAANALHAAYQATGASKSSAAASDKGNELRKLLLEPFRDELSGTGRYVVLPDGPLWSVSLGVLPEQKSSMRYLADVRTIGYGATVGDAWRDLPDALGKYNPEYLGLSALGPDDAMTEDGLKIPTETENSGRHFDEGAKVVRSGPAATAATLLEHAGEARMIHLAAVHEGAHGGIKLGDGTVSLAEIRALELHGHTVFITTDASSDVLSRWVQAFRSAGCATVITTSWDTPLALRSKFVYTFYESLIQHGSPARALLQARQSLREELNLQGLGADPGWWGPYFLHGQP